eukprot:264334-Amphidinium_carterae.1
MKVDRRDGSLLGRQQSLCPSRPKYVYVINQSYRASPAAVWFKTVIVDCCALMPLPGSGTTELAAAQLAQTLAESAAEGLKQLQASAQVEDGDLACAQCGSVLFEPITLEDGETVCRPCVQRYRDARGLSSQQSRLPTWASTPDSLGFGASTTLVLAALIDRCSPQAVKAASLRHEANRHFEKQSYVEAEQTYSSAIDDCGIKDVALLCNRSAARLKLGNVEGALADGAAA